MRNTLKVAASIATAALLLTACGSNTGSSGSTADADATTQAGAEETDDADDAPAAGGDAYSIGVVQLVAHPSLDATNEGFVQALEDAGIAADFDQKNANGDQTVASTIAGTFASQGLDLVLAIATPAAQAAAQAITDIPVLFTAVTDPVDAELVASADAPGANITGTTDANPGKEQLQLILDIVPGAATIGIPYSPGEANSLVQVQWAKDAAAELGLEIKEAPATTSADVLQAAETLKDVDAIYVPTDNVVVSSLESVLQVGETNQVPVFGAEGDSVARGAIATYGLSYYALGYQTGEMAIDILVNGADPATMSVQTQNDLLLYLNLGAAERMGVEIPQELLDQADPENITE